MGVVFGVARRGASLDPTTGDVVATLAVAGPAGPLVVDEQGNVSVGVQRIHLIGRRACCFCFRQRGQRARYLLGQPSPTPRSPRGGTLHVIMTQPEWVGPDPQVLVGRFSER